MQTTANDDRTSHRKIGQIPPRESIHVGNESRTMGPLLQERTTEREVRSMATEIG